MQNHSVFVNTRSKYLGEFDRIGKDTIRKKFSTYCMGVTFDHQCVGGDFILVCSNLSSLCTFYIDF